MRTRLRLIAALAALAPVLGCHQPEPTQSINTPPTDPAEQRRELAEFFAYHQDQGMMHDRSIADIHFVPGAAHLSGAGEARLARYAELLADGGGTLQYDTRLNDDTLVQNRLAAARAFLSQCNVGGPPIQVALGMPGGRGMRHDEAFAGRAVAQQPEPRTTAYRLSNAGGESSGGSN